MRLTAYHDSSGHIVGLAASADDVVPAEVISTEHPGLRATEVEVPSGVELDPDRPQQLHEQLAKMAETYRIDPGSLSPL